jgi:hypothetical protein
MRKQITKVGYKTMIWGIITAGIVINAVWGYLFINSGVSKIQMQYGLWMSLGTIVLGFGVGLAYARNWFIKEIDDLKGGKN